MITITIPPRELFDEPNSEFIQFNGATLQMEHSLISLSEWESKWKKPFLDKPEERTNEELVDYFRCMTITKNVDPNAYRVLTPDNVNRLISYINDPMTATWFSDDKKPGRRNNETITSELIYYWMIAQNIPFECRKWHLNRLLTLIRVCNIKSAPPKKMGRQEQLQRQRELNAARKKKLGTTG